MPGRVYRKLHPEITLTEEERMQLERIRQSRSESVRHVQRASILLLYADGQNKAAIARDLGMSLVAVNGTIRRARKVGVLQALDDLPRSGHPEVITPEAKAWLIALACQKPTALGYPHEVWTYSLLAQHVRAHCEEAGHPSLARLAKGTISKILRAQDIHPHRIEYYLEKRGPEFDAKMAEVLAVYQEVEILRESGDPQAPLKAILSYDEKPGIQAIANTAPDRLPKPGVGGTLQRDHEYVRLGTLSVLSGIDLVTGHVHHSVCERHRSAEFIEFLKAVDAYYPPGVQIHIILDNHSAHTSKQTRSYLESVPGRFTFVFTPKHGSWLNIIESFFAKMSRTVLRHIRVNSKEELRERIEQYLDELNKHPVPFRWRYGLQMVRE
ncbi:IS630 family transposase [Kyrpidia tusciae]|uniref:Tc1-like transposase DDE domain-containing protein n=1 Tax=Kyrpidia tusciae (strain DSM 2912 / NBRC 15312 / T2) TaxID=562970 RepID=D5WRU3_KYRT2|nr:IS630 family transposase [Kyrpidia tusciae]ADG06895.1 conserved hypothetical protein [Kyrpidia tusciae DSM 2912]